MEKNLKRTKMCGEFSLSDLDQQVCVMGWVSKNRDLGKMIFLEIRDRTGYIQVVVNDNINQEFFEIAKKIRSEYVVAITGTLKKRSDETINNKISTGEIEVIADEIKILSKSEVPPFQVDDKSNVNEQTRLQYRYLDLRSREMQHNLKVRHQVAKITRDFLDDNGFLEIETPMLIKSTPEGARDFLVPSRILKGKFFSLPQSPQLYKQLLMVSGVDKYFQIAKCFRDEDLRADRQPEFTQIDMEMSFVSADDIMSLNERLIQQIFKQVLNIDIQIPLQRLTYTESMNRFGSDRPDTRFGMELVDLSDIFKNSEFKVFANAISNGGSVRAIKTENASQKISRKEIDSLTEFVKIYKAKGLAWLIIENNEIKSPIAKFLSDQEKRAILERMNARNSDIVFLVADKNSIVFDALGNLRLELAKKMDLINKSLFNFLWVTEFPLFKYDEDEKRLVAEHHPFTSPMLEDINLLENTSIEELTKIRAQAYDIILNGVELGGGSIRISNGELQNKMFKLLGFNQESIQEQFGFLIDAFKYGVPPHGGIAYGLDRLIMLMTDQKSIRDVIAFPKVQSGAELLSGAPSDVDIEQLEQLNILIISKNDKDQ